MTGTSRIPSVWVGNKFIGGYSDLVSNLDNCNLQKWVAALEKSRAGVEVRSGETEEEQANRARHAREEVAALYRE